jgi:hypothetical protein
LQHVLRMAARAAAVCIDRHDSNPLTQNLKL